MADILKAKVKASGQEVQVYRLHSGGWCNFSDCKTRYNESELIFKN